LSTAGVSLTSNAAVLSRLPTGQARNVVLPQWTVKHSSKNGLKSFVIEIEGVLAELNGGVYSETSGIKSDSHRLPLLKLRHCGAGPVGMVNAGVDVLANGGS